MQWNEFRSHIGHFSARQLQRVREAFELGKRMHAGQTRRSGEPYFSHPVSVATMLAGMGADPDTIIAALLHDTVEDTPLTLQEIETLFGSSVGTIIEGVTKLNAADVAEKPNLNEQIETLRKIFTLMERDVRIMVIKLVDRLHNIQTAEFLPPDRQQILAEETRDVYVKIADRLCMQDMRDELKGFALAILNPEEFTKLSALRTQNEARGEEVLRSMQQRVLNEHPAALRQISMHYEHKAWEKIREQLQNEGMVITGISAVTAVFVCPTIDDCYRILGILHQLWKRESLSFQDFINAPAVNGYRGLHTTVILEDGTRVRCKIRTTAMQAYARKGIALRCFDGKPEGLLEYLPWTVRISPLAQDTEGRSSEFWQSLQSDILGESIVIYGPGDQSVTVPAGSTALDGAFHLFRDAALKITSISIGGKTVPFNTPLQQATSLNVTMSDTPTVERAWLQWVKTGLSVARIRSALAIALSPAEKHALGKELLQNVFREKRRGFIEEFDAETLEEKIQEAGYNSLENAYADIADGRADPAEVFRALFLTAAPRAAKRHVTVAYNIDMDDADAMDRLNLIHRTYGPSLLEIRYRRSLRQNASLVTIRANMTPEEERAFIESLERAGAMRLRRSSRFAGVFSLTTVCVLFVLWGLDPVIAGLLLRQWVAPPDLTIIRFWTLAAISGLLLLWTRWRNPLAEARLPLKNASLWASVGLLLCVAITSYIALQTTEPSHYTIPMTAAGILLTSIVNRKRWITLLFTWLCLLGGIALLIALTPGWPLSGIAFTLLAVMAFSLFSVISERYKRAQHVEIRAAQYFFALSLSCAVFSLLLLPFTALVTLSWPVILAAILFSFLFSGLPYYIYYYLLSHRELDFVLRFSFLIILTTVIGQAAIMGAVAWPIVIASGTLVTAGAVLPLLHPPDRSDVR